MVLMVPDVSWPSRAKTEWEKEGDAELAGEENRVWQEIGTGFEVVTETVRGERWKVSGKVHNWTESVEMLEEMLCDGGDDMDTMRWMEEGVMEDARIPTVNGDVVPIGKEKGTGEMNGKDCVETEKACG